ncbi:MAG: hypothetical protein ACJA0U_002953 [Salibacteraceae bacterium]|jgi:hypothetical protein
MVEKWEGNYKYKSKIIQKIVGHPCTFFTLEIEIFKDDTLKGKIKDDNQSDGMSGVGEVVGEIHENAIYFEKQMPNKSTIIDTTGTRKTSKEKHPLLIYQGELVGDKKYNGTWKFERRRKLLLGFIPIMYSSGSGTWEMELKKR